MNFRRLHPLSALGPLRAWAALWMAASVSIFAAEHPPSASAPAGITSLDEEEQSLLKLGSRLGERGDFDAAEIAFRQVLGSPRTQATDEKTALLGLAQLHRRQGALTKAAAIYERFLKEYPDADETPEAMLTLGRTLRALGAHKLAIARFYSVLNSTLKLGGASLDRYQLLAKTAQFEIAETHFQAGNFAEASKFFSRLRLLDLAPVDRARAHFKAGYSLRLQGDLEGAVGSLRAYLEQWPQDDNVPEARYLLAVTLRELKRPQEALAATLELLRAEQARGEADTRRWAYWQRKTGNQLANDFYESGDAANARAIYAGLIELSTDPAWRLPITYQLALCDERLGVADRARLAYEEIVKAAAAPNAPADLAELAKMAKWRIEHLAWRDRVSVQLSKALESSAGKSAAVTPPPTTPATP